MSHLSPSRPRRARVIALPLLVLACSGLAACGSSSSTNGAGAGGAAATSSTQASTAGTPTTKATGSGTSTGTGTSGGNSANAAGSSSGAAGNSATSAPGSAFTARLAAMRTCIQKGGVTLPLSNGAPGAMFSNPQLPKGMTRPQYTELLRRCTTTTAGSAAAAKSRLSNTRFHQALIVFADCLRKNGIPVPQPNTSGKGPIFDTRGLDTTSPKFRQVRQKCRSTLLGTLRAKAHSGAH